MVYLLKTPIRRVNRSLRLKALCLIGFTVLALIILLIGLSHHVLLRSFADLERQQVERNVRRVQNRLEYEQHYLDATVSDWAYWNDTYNFMLTQDAEYLASNLSPDSFATINVNLVVFLDSDAQPVLARLYDLEAVEEVPLPPSISKALVGNPRLLNEGDMHQAVSGIILIPEGPLMIASRPILTSQKTGPAVGTLVFGRLLDTSEISAIAESTSLEVSFRRLDDPQLPADYQTAQRALRDGLPVVTQVLDGSTVAGYMQLEDIYGLPALIVRIELPRDVYLQGKQAVTYFLLATLLSGGVFMVVTMLLVELLGLRRLLRLSNLLRAIGAQGDLAARVPVQGTDELSAVAESVNHMLSALQESQNTLLASEVRLQEVVESINDAVYMADLTPDGIIRSHWILSPRYTDLTGYPLQRFAEDWLFWISIIHPDDQPAARAYLDRLMHERQGVIEYRVIKADGSIAWIRDSGHLKPAPSGETLILYGVLSDITTYKQTEAALRDSEARFSSLIAEMPVNLYRTTPSGEFLDVNPALVHLMGYPDFATLKTRNAIDLYVDPMDRIRWQTMITHESGVGVYELRLRRYDGSVIWVRDVARAIRDEEGHVLYYLGGIEDITERKRAEEELANAQALLMAAIEQTPAGILIADAPDVRLRLANSEAGRILGLAGKELLDIGREGKPDHLDLFHPDGSPYLYEDTPLPRAILEGITTHNDELLVRLNTGEERWLLVNAAPVRNAAGEIIAGVLVFLDITDSRRAKEALARSEERLQRVLEGSNDGFWDWNIETGELLVSPRWAEMLGYEVHELPPRIDSWDKLVHPDDLAGMQKALDEHFANQTPYYAYECRIKTKAGEWRWVLNRGKVVARTADGKPLRMAGTCSDISARKLAEETRARLEAELQRQIHLLDMILLTTPDHFLVFDRAGRCTYFSPEALTFIHQTGGEAIGKAWHDLPLPAELSAALGESLRAVLETGHSVSGITPAEIGNTLRFFETILSPAHDSDGQISYSVFTLRDVTSRMEMLSELADSEEKYRVLYEQASDAILLIRDGVYVDCNGGALELFGCERADLVGCAAGTPAPEVQPNGRLSAEMAREKLNLVLQGEPQRFEWQHYRLDGTLMDVEVRLNRIRLNDEMLVLAIVRDITERKRIEAVRAEERLLLRTVIDQLPDTIYVKDLDGRVRLANRADTLIRGATDPEAVAGKTDFDFYAPDLAARFAADDRLVMQTGQSLVNREELFDVPGSEPRWLLTTKVPLRNEAGEIVGMVGIGHDITDLKRAEERLRFTQFATDQAAEGIFWIEDSGRIAYANEAACRMLGYSASELLSMAVFDINPLVPPPDWPTHWNAIKEAGSRVFESINYTRDGRAIPVEITDKFLSFGGIEYACAFVRDISERKQAEAERERLLRQMEIRARELATVATISLQAATILDVEQLLWTAVNLTRDNFDLYHAHIYLLDRDSDTLVLAAGSGDAGRKMVESGYKIPVQQPRSIAARAARMREGVLVNDVRSDPGFLPNELLPDTRSEMAIPMMVGEELIGVLDVQAVTVGRFSAEDMSVQLTLAAQLAIAIHNARLFAENARRLAIIENSDSLVLLAPFDAPNSPPIYINSAGTAMLGYDSVEDVLARPIADFFKPEGVALIEQEIMPTIAAKGIWRGENEVRRCDGSARPVEQTVFLIYDKAGRPQDVAMIITDISERKQAEQALQRMNRAYRMLSDCNQAMVRAGDEVSLLNEVCTIIVQSGNYRMGWVGLVEYDDLCSIRPAAFAGYEEGYLATLNLTWADTEHGQGPDGLAVRTRRTQVIRDLRHAPRGFAPWKEAALARGYASLITLPLLEGDRVFGTLNVYSDRRDAFDATEVELLEELASDLAFGIVALRIREQHRRAQQAEREQRILAEALRDTAAAINSTLDLDKVLEQILSNLERVAPHNQANIMLVEGGIAHVVRSRGYPSPEIEAWVESTPFVVNEIAGLRRMMETQEPLIIPDLSAHDEWTDLPQTRWVRSYAGVPIMHNQRLIGFINLDSDTPNMFSADHIERLKVFANQAAVAIKNAQLYDEVQHYAEELEERVRQRTAELEAQRAQLQAILDSMGEGVIYTVGEQAVYVNQALVDLLGYSADEIVGHSYQVHHQIMSAIANYEQMRRNIQRAFERGLSWRGEVQVRRADGDLCDVAITLTQVRIHGVDQPRRVVSVFRDISQEKALRAQKDRFIANASHELRTPLANMKTRLYLMKRQPDKIEQHMEVLERVTGIMTDLVESLLDVSRFERGVIQLFPTPLVMQTLLNEVIGIHQPAAEEKGITMTLTVPDAPLTVMADRQRMAQVVTNLLLNAINELPEGGQIDVMLNREPPSPDHPNGRAVFTVHDNGSGIDPDLLPQVFEPFFRAHQGTATGTGLSLTIAQEIVRLHGGEIGVESAVNQGSTFTVKLDLAGGSIPYSGQDDFS